jgi:shikimate dehydrogenase
MRSPVTRATHAPARLVILGHPIAHSRSPAMHNAALVHLGLSPRYEAMDVHPTELDRVLTGLAHEHAAGNVTIPHKEALARAASCTALAERVGAVNTFWHDDGRLIGHNTDVAGATETIRALCGSRLDTQRCAVLGAGGAAAAVLVALDALGCTDITIASRSSARASSLIDRLGVSARVAATAEAAARGAGLVINATPVGLFDDATPLGLKCLEPGAAVFDLVYRADETAWVRQCRAAGHKAADGFPMLIEQGAAAFECWFGISPPLDILIQSARAGSGAR